ncbi:hypothetical protein [Thalassomonas haliotis]|uniref:Uncharacterized protein n=1 Tax=Thalassomonas haliotis TaxID=485448 RepID=A0ABY7VD03_9GAMM|nr:hypothetical protein [Thalassomonas haliotis]WDE11568.1 hypothetical protein H3N35_25755 [Thalassomonas haliotis]
MFKIKFNNKALLAATVVTLGVMASMPSQAATTTYKLVKTSNLTNVNDAEGRWQFDGGYVYIGNTHVGYYTRKKRVSFGIPSSVNKSSMEMTVIWKWGNYNFTVQGSHYFGTGTEVGGVSATSAGFTYLEDATFAGNHNAITITY